MTAISNTTSVPAYTPPVNTQRVTSGKDADGDNDGSKAGEVEKTAAHLYAWYVCHSQNYLRDQQ
jgi:hypothetical protein